MQTLLGKLTLAFIAIIFSTSFLHAQPPLKQIVSIPWGTEQDYLGADICKMANGTYTIASTLTPNHRGKENSRANLYRVFTSDGRLTYQFQPQQAKYLSGALVEDMRIYLSNAQNKIYRCQLPSNAIDSIQTEYSPLYLLSREYRGKKSILVTSSSGYYLYDAATLALTQQIPTSKPISSTGKPPIAGDKIYCLKQGNEIVCYNLNTKKTVWSVATTAKAAKWLGITVGTFDDVFLHYALNKDGSTLYAITGFGCIYKINAATGAVLKQVERFRGDANNAGLVTEFSFADVNGDGVEDLIGSAVDYNLYAINGKDLSVIWAYNTGYENQAGVSLYDITGDGIVDVFSINDKMKLSIVNGKTGAKIHEYQIQPDKSQAKVILADINGNGLLDIFISGGSKAIRAFEMSWVKVPVGSILWMPEGL